MLPRTDAPELLDSDCGSGSQVERSLSDLRDINHWLGGFSTHTALFQRVARKTGARRLRVLEVAAGRGESIVHSRKELRKRGVQLDITLLDLNPSHLPHREASVAGSAFALPFRDQSFDVVSSCLFLHHLSPSEVPRCLPELLRVARLAVVINDLRRSRLHLAFAYLGKLAYRSPITAHDSVVSVRRAYTLAEFHEMTAKFAPTDAFTHWLFRFGAILWKCP